jgi:ATP-dependent protease ClpP protease subunit
MINRRKRGFVQALAPAVALAHDAAPKRAAADMPGLALRAATTDLGAELMIYGVIGGGFWTDGITDAGIAELLAQVGPKPIHVRINSGGGDVFQGTAIYSLLAQHPGVVTVTIDGLAGSAASVVMLAGDVIRAPKHSFGMLHDAMTSPYGNSATLRRTADILDKVSGTMAEMYADKAGEDAEYWRNVMTVNGEDGTWYTGEELVAVGLADEVLVLAKEDDEVAARLAGWVDILPSSIVSTLTLPPEPVEDDPAPAVMWNPADLLNLTKGVFAR